MCDQEYFDQYNLTSNCYYLGNRYDVKSDIEWTLLLNKLNNIEFERTARRLFNLHQTIKGDKFACYLYKDGQKLAHAQYTFVEETYIYLDGLYREKNIPILTYPLGKIILIHALLKAKERGAKNVVLLATDMGSGKLFHYYHEMGFRCIDFTQAESPYDQISISTYNDFFSGNEIERTTRNMTQCYMMMGNIDQILHILCFII